MKRLLAVALVGLLVVAAGCGMTSPEAQQASQKQQPTTTTASAENPHAQLTAQAPSKEDYPPGFSKSGIENATEAYRGHLAALREGTFQVIYLVNESRSKGTRLAITNGSGPDREWLTSMGLQNVGPQRWIYRDGNTRYIRNSTGHGSANVSATQSPYRLTDGTFDGRSLDEILSRMEISKPQLRTTKNSTYILYWVQGYGDHNVSGGHVLVYPDGQIRFIYIRYEGGTLQYRSTVSPRVTVSEPPWVANASTAG